MQPYLRQPLVDESVLMVDILLDKFFSKEKLLLSKSEEEEMCELYEMKLAMVEVNKTLTNRLINPSLN